MPCFWVEDRSSTMKTKQLQRFSGFPRNLFVCRQYLKDIIYITFHRRLIIDSSAIQSRTPSTAGGPEPTTGIRFKPALQGGPLLRCSRPGAGQVRNASPGRARGKDRGRKRGCVRILSPGLLPYQSSLRVRRTFRTPSAQERTARSAQTNARAAGVLETMSRRGLFAKIGGTGLVVRKTLSSPLTPPNNRTRARKGKKKHADRAVGPAPDKRWSARYEDVRTKALARSQGRRCNEGVGLSLVLSQGVLGWMSAWVTQAPETDQPASPKPLQNTLPPNLKDQLSQVMATILVGACGGVS